ncbi:MAG TPA: AI-2E family transporter [Thermoanaerobaculia bacterium]|nr:AI-2E family transporter [Thermoanaerobaculia bacterium]
MNNKNLSRYFFIAVLLGTTIVFFRMVQVFLVPVLLAAVFATLFYPMYEFFVRRFRGRRSLAAFTCCFILLLGLVAPLYAVADMVTREAITVYQSAEVWIGDLLRKGGEGPLARLRTLPFLRDLRLDQIDWASTLKDAATSAGSFLATLINKTSRGTLQIVVTLFTTLFTMFYFFRDGKDLLRRLRFLIPLDREYKNAIASRFSAVARATVKGTLLIAIVQGTLSGLTLWIFGVGSPILWGVVATLLSIIPLVGAWLVLYPAAFVQIATGHLWQGIGILLITVLVIVNVDNLMRPRLVGQETGMHDLMVFFSTLGGIGMFGPTGFIIGPMVAALFLTLLDIYSAEFKEDLDGTWPLKGAQAAPAGAAIPQLEPPEVRDEPVMPPKEAPG